MNSLTKRKLVKVNVYVLGRKEDLRVKVRIVGNFYMNHVGKDLGLLVGNFYMNHVGKDLGLLVGKDLGLLVGNEPSKEVLYEI